MVNASKVLVYYQRPKEEDINILYFNFPASQYGIELFCTGVREAKKGHIHQHLHGTKSDY